MAAGGDLAGSRRDRLGRVAHLRDGAAQRGNHGRQRIQQAARHRGAHHRDEIAPGDLVHREHGFFRVAADLQQDAAADEVAKSADGHQGRSGDGQGLDQGRTDLRVDVVRVDAGADDPTPFLDAGDVLQLGHRDGAPRPREFAGHESGSVRAGVGRLDEFLDGVDALRIPDLAKQVVPVPLQLEGVHHAFEVAREDVDVVLGRGAEADSAQRVLGFLLGLLLRKSARRCARLEGGNNASRRLNDRHQLGGTAVNDAGAQPNERDGREKTHARDRHGDERGDLLLEAERFEHGASEGS